MTQDVCRLLELLAASADGSSEALLLAHGYSHATIVNGVRAGFAMFNAESTPFGLSTVEITRVRLTDAGRRALAKQ
jgi:hypothetical protein